MAEDTSFRFAEYGHAVKSQGKNRILRTLFICALVLFSIGFILLFTVLVKIPQLIAVLPIFLYIFVLAFWRFLSYDCSTKVEAGKLSFCRVNGKKSRELFSCRVKELIYIGDDTEDHRAYIEKTYGLPITSYSSEAEVPMKFVAVAKTSEGQYAFAFDAHENVKKELLYYNRSLFE